MKMKIDKIFTLSGAVGSVDGGVGLTEEAGPSYEHFDSDVEEESSPVKVEAEDVEVELTEEEDAEVTDNLDLNAVEGNSRDDRDWVAQRDDEGQSHSSSEQEAGSSNDSKKSTSSGKKQRNERMKSVRGSILTRKLKQKGESKRRSRKRMHVIEAKDVNGDKKTFTWEADKFFVTVVFPEKIQIVTDPPRPPQLDKMCPVCEAKFDTIKDVEKHAREEHGDVKQPFACDQCGHRFEKMERLKVHIFHLHTEEGQAVYRKRQEKRNEKRRGIPLPAERKEIKNRKRREKRKQSKNDGRQLVRLGNSDRWVDPNSPPPLKCPDCTEEFDTLTRLRRHHAAEHQERPYTCHTCGKGFNTSYNFHSHLRSHQEDRPYVCDECGFMCKTLHQLNGHIQQVHDEVGKQEYKQYRRQLRVKDGEKRKKEMTGTQTAVVSSDDDIDFQQLLNF